MEPTPATRDVHVHLAEPDLPQTPEDSSNFSYPGDSQQPKTSKRLSPIPEDTDEYLYEAQSRLENSPHEFRSVEEGSSLHGMKRSEDSNGLRNKQDHQGAEENKEDKLKEATEPEKAQSNSGENQGRKQGKHEVQIAAQGGKEREEGYTEAQRERRSSGPPEQQYDE